MKNNQIIKRKYYALSVSLASPLNIHGQDDETHADLLVNGNGEAFIPGTSIAGVWRSYLEQTRNKNTIFGYESDTEGRMSRIFISDLILQDIAIETRDNVALSNDEKIAKPGVKFDMEIAAAGRGVLYFNYVKRETDTFPYDELIHTVIQAIQNGEIRFGAKKTRGFGRLHIDHVYEAEFTPDQLDQWLQFETDEKDLKHYQSTVYDKWDKQSDDTKYLHINIPLKLTGGISIRRYSTVPGEADYEHIHSNGNPIIPGSSWAGAIRHDANEILHGIVTNMNVDLHIADVFMDDWFGFVDGNIAQESRIVIGESILNNSTSLVNIRNRIDRFDNSTEDGALYKERMNAGGNTVLSIMIRKDTGYEAAAGLIGLVLKDIEEGYLAVGGGTAIGRGIFYGTEKLPDGRALYAYLKKEAANDH